MNDYRLDTVYCSTTEAQRREIMQFWERVGAVPDAVERERRSHEVVVMVHNMRGELVGVSTVMVRMASNGERYYYFRMFIHPQHREARLMRAVGQCTRDFLATFCHPDGEVRAMVVVTENPKLMRQGMRQLFERIGYTYNGKTSKGLDCWVFRFL